jgi:SAM-dependent methyltransferase
MTPTPAADLVEVNRSFYDRLWRDTRLHPPERFNTWPLISTLAAQAPRRLEIGPGMRPRLPIAGSAFLDLSAPAVAALTARGGEARAGSALDLPFAPRSFDLVCAFDVVEHLEDDARVLDEIDRVLDDHGTLVMSVPLFQSRWTAFDAQCGHFRRYEPERLLGLLAARRLAVASSAGYAGMQPARPWVVDLGMWFTRAMPRRAMLLYNYVIMPIALRLQQPLVFAPGMVDAAALGLDEVVLVCRRTTGR